MIRDHCWLSAIAYDPPQARGPTHRRDARIRVQAHEEVTGEEGLGLSLAVLPHLNGGKIGFEAVAFQKAADVPFLMRLGVESIPMFHVYLPVPK
jgi:hypothetical protein